MADIFMYRGGTPDFKPLFGSRDWPEFQPPLWVPGMPDVAPYDSHADGAQDQGYLNLHFPLIPNLAGTDGHKWMQNALVDVIDVYDTVWLNWVPLRSYVDSYFIEVSRFDKRLNGVYVQPVMARQAYNFTTKSYDLIPVNEFANDLTQVGVTQLPLGEPASGDTIYGMCRLTTAAGAKPYTYGHNLTVKDADGNPIRGWDEFYGSILVGLRVSEGDPDKIKLLAKSDVAVYTSMKLLCFSGSSQVG